MQLLISLEPLVTHRGDCSNVITGSESFIIKLSTDKYCILILITLLLLFTNSYDIKITFFVRGDCAYTSGIINNNTIVPADLQL